MSNNGKSLYDILGIGKNADSSEIRKSYMKLARTHHPDKGGDAEEFKQIQKAYEVLSDEKRRSMYDMTGSADDSADGGGPGGAGGMPFPFPFDLGGMFSMFGQGFGGGGGERRGRPRAPKAPPKVHPMPISLHDYYHGKRVKIQFERQKFCTNCKGEGADTFDSCGRCGGSGSVEQHIMMGPGMMGVMRGPCQECGGEGRRATRSCSSCEGKKYKTEVKTLDVVIEPGTHPGTDRVFERECSDEPDYAEPGDVRIVFNDADEDFRFKRHTTAFDDLVVYTRICLRDALLGCKETMYGHPGYPQGLVVEIPAGIQNKGHIEIPDKGMPKRGITGAYGTLHVFIDVVASEDEKAALRNNRDAVEQIFKGVEVKGPGPGSQPVPSPWPSSNTS